MARRYRSVIVAMPPEKARATALRWCSADRQCSTRTSPSTRALTRSAQQRRMGYAFRLRIRDSGMNRESVMRLSQAPHASSTRVSNTPIMSTAAA